MRGSFGRSFGTTPATFAPSKSSLNCESTENGKKVEPSRSEPDFYTDPRDRPVVEVDVSGFPIWAQLSLKG